MGLKEMRVLTDTKLMQTINITLAVDVTALAKAGALHIYDDGATIQRYEGGNLEAEVYTAANGDVLLTADVMRKGDQNARTVWINLANEDDAIKLADNSAETLRNKITEMLARPQLWTQVVG